MKANTYIKRIEVYFKNQMSDSDKLAFEEELRSDPELSEALEKYKISRKAIDLLSEEALRSKLTNWRSENKTVEQVADTSKIKTSDYRNLSWLKTIWSRPSLRTALAASIILVMSISIYFIITNDSNKNTIVSFFYTPASEQPRSNSNSNLIAALEAYQNKKYNDAVALLKTVKPTIDISDFYLAQSHFYLRDYDAAEKYFRQVETLDDTSYKQEAEWNLIVTLLVKDAKNKEALDLLNHISSNEGHSFYNQASILKNHLKTNN